MEFSSIELGTLKMWISVKSLEHELGLCSFPAFQIIKNIADMWLILNDRFRNSHYNFMNCIFQDWEQEV